MQASWGCPDGTVAFCCCCSTSPLLLPCSPTSPCGQRVSEQLLAVFLLCISQVLYLVGRLRPLGYSCWLELGSSDGNFTRYLRVLQLYCRKYLSKAFSKCRWRLQLAKSVLSCSSGTEKQHYIMALKLPKQASLSGMLMVPWGPRELFPTKCKRILLLIPSTSQASYKQPLINCFNRCV